MKLNLAEIRGYKRLFSSVQVIKHPVYESVFISTKYKKLVFLNETSKVFIDFNIEMEDGEEDIEKSFNGLKFFALVQNYDTMQYKNGFFISENGDKFKIESDSDELSDILDLEEELESVKHTDWNKIVFEVDEEFYSNLKKSLHYIDSNQYSSKGALFLHEDIAVAIQENKLFQFSNTTNIEDFKLPPQLIKILVIMELQGDVELYIKESLAGKVTIFKYGPTIFKTTINDFYELPADPKDEEFISSYDHADFFSITKDELLSTLRFLEPFTKDIINSRIQFMFDDKGEIFININEELDNISYKLKEYTYISNPELFFNKNFWINLIEIKLIVNDISSEKINIFFSEESPALKIKGDEEDYFFVKTKILEG